MAFPTDTEPLRAAVLYALTTTTGQPRAIRGEYLFRELEPADGAARAAAVKNRPGVTVDVLEDGPADGSMLEMSDRARLAVRVVITIVYASGASVSAAERRAASRLRAADTARILSALCYPGALDVDQYGNETGVDGGALVREKWSASGPATQPARSADARVLRVVHTFRTSVELAQPT